MPWIRCQILEFIAVITLVLIISSIAFADSYGPLGPNPLAGDGMNDGSSLVVPYGPNESIMSGLYQYL